MTTAGRLRRAKARQREIVRAKIALAILITASTISGMMLDSNGTAGNAALIICITCMGLSWLIYSIYIPKQRRKRNGKRNYYYY